MATLDFSRLSSKGNVNSAKRFINYVLSHSSDSKSSAQTVQFDTITQRAVFASDFFFKPEELKYW